MDSRRLLKIVSTEDDSEVTILLPADIQDQPFALPGQTQDGSQHIRHIPTSEVPTQLSNVHQQHSSVYQSYGQYPSSKLQSGQSYTAGQQQLKSSQYQQSQIQGQTSQYATNENRPVLSTATRTIQSGNVWPVKDFSTWTPKLASSKWLQQDPMQQKYYESFTQDDPVASNEQPVSTSTSIPIKSSLASIFPVKHARTATSMSGVTRVETVHGISSIDSQKLEGSFAPQSQTLETLRGDVFPQMNTFRDAVSPQVPINLSSETHAHPNDFQHNLNSRGNVTRKTLPVTGFSLNAQTMNSSPSPVYKSKLEKAVEQNHNGNVTVTSSTSGLDAKYHSGTLKRLLSSGIDEMSAYKLFQTLDIKPQFGTLTEPMDNHMQTRDQNQFLFPDVSSNKADHILTKTLSEKILPKKKEILLDKALNDRFKEPYAVVSASTASSSGSLIAQQSLPRFAYLPGLAISQLEQHLQDYDKGLESQPIESYNKTDFSKYKQTLMEREGHNRSSGGVPSIEEYSAPFVNDGIKSAQSSGVSFLVSDPVCMDTYASPFMTAGVKSTHTSVTDVGSMSEVKMACNAPPYLTEIVPEVTSEKEYVNPNWSEGTMQKQWILRENGHFCDAVLHCNTGKFKFHRIVMAAASPDFLNRDHSGSEEIQLELPMDILYENVCLFMKYLYLGKIELTIVNVQQIYRLATLFDIGDLNKYCYDFCKLAKLGHLIISSPYLETARQVCTKQDKSEAEKTHTDNSTMEPAPLEITDVGTIDQIADILTEKAQKLEHSNDLDFDWLTSDPDQSNIPIRKRGRTRHKLNVAGDSANANKTKDVEITPKKLKMQLYAGKSEDLSKQEQLSNKDKNNLSKKVNFYNSFEIESEDFTESQKQRDTLKSVERAHEHIDELTMQLSELPDPLATGKFDETQLFKQDKIVMKAQKLTLFNNKPARKTMVTRFRGKPKTMTVLEAATHKKARYDVPLGMTTRKTSKEKTFGRKKLKVLKPKLKHTTETQNLTDKKAVSNQDVNDVEETLLEISEAKEKKSPSKEKSDNKKQIESTLPISPKVYKAVPAKKRQGLIENSLSKLVENVDEDMAGKAKEVTSFLQTDQSPEDTIHLKKPRLRKSTLDQQQDTPVKDPVYMRPPKKRTKEIREMMKIDDDVSETVKSESQMDQKLTSGDLKQKMSAGQYKGLMKACAMANLEVQQKKQTKSKLLNSEAILGVVYEVEQYGKSIEGEKQYRCCLCNSVFVFSKRVITHIVNTHDISLEETIDYIDVQHKKPQSKKCDICGYVTKEINIYYIHFHKYFKHGVPLPKGWHPFRCDLCKKEFFTKFQLREHKLIHFEDNPFVCELCGSGFKSRTGLNSHMFHKHSSVRKHKCPDCIKSFKTRTQMKVHHRTHSGEKPYGCRDPQCNYRSTTRGNMKLHLLNRHKYTTESVNQIMRELQSSVSETSVTDIDDPSELWEIQVENEEDEVQSELPVKMERFDVSHAGFESLVGAAAELANADKHFMASHAHGEAKDHASTGTVNDQVQTIADQIMVQIVDNNKVTYNVQRNIGHQPDRNIMKMPGLPTQNLPRHVELLMQTSNTGLQNSDLTPQDRQMISDFTNRNPDSSNITQLTSDEGLCQQLHVVRSQGNMTACQDELVLSSSTGQQKLRVQPRDNRIMIKQDFQGVDKKSLLKSAIQAVENETLLRQEDSRLLHAQRSFNGQSVNVTASAGLREQIMSEDQIIHDLRQVQGHSNFPEENQNIYRVENTSQNIVFTSQQQSSQDHLHLIAEAAPISPPPAYHPTSQSELTATQSSLLLAHLQMRQGQDLSQRQGLELSQVQGHDMSQGHEHTLSQGQGNDQNQCHPGSSSSLPQDFSNIIVSQPNTTQFNSNEEHLYPGFYQENYQIENY